MQKKRLDVILVERGYVPSRERAKSLIMSGIVFVDGERVDKAGSTIAEDANLEVRGSGLSYVSRGGLKLEKAMQKFPIVLNQKVCMDIGASTGGFTDCMLQNGAKKVFAVDVGYGQLAWKLRCDERVVNLERTNVRYLTAEQVGEPVDFISVDVSFISLTLVLPVAKTYLSENGEMVCLIKPQFEAGRENVGKKGVVRDKQVHIDVVNKITSFAKENNFVVKGLTFSPVKGPEGNIEYLIYLKKGSGKLEIEENLSEQIVLESHLTLDT
ncbi:MAG: TlyA family RNA methyltransferase [Oscillospiraceae bacterium]|nr:TlyA family RNA methyltransferase [Oscillospiraceae bacterium]